MLRKRVSLWFKDFAQATARVAGKPVAFGSAVTIVILWSVSDPMFGFSDTWQLVINTSTTIITFLMVFVIQNTQNRDSHAIQVKLDELIRATEGARNALLDLEQLSDEELTHIHRSYEELAKRARTEMREGLRVTEE